MQDWLTLDRRPTLVFGAGGLGGACALSLAAQGARVALVDVNQDKLDAVVRPPRRPATSLGRPGLVLGPSRSARMPSKYSRRLLIRPPSKTRTAISRIRLRTPWTTSSNSASTPR